MLLKPMLIRYSILSSGHQALPGGFNPHRLANIFGGYFVRHQTIQNGTCLENMYRWKVYFS